MAKGEFPIAAKAIEEDFYMDDCVTGSHTEKSAMKLAKFKVFFYYLVIKQYAIYYF